MNNPTQLLHSDIIGVEVPRDASQLKKCSICKEDKPFESFGVRGKGSNVLKSGCKECYSLKYSCDKSKTIIKDLDGEKWNDIEDFEGLYQVSNLGRIKSLDRYLERADNESGYKKSQLLKQTPNHKGYKMVTLYKNKKAKTLSVHRIVSKAFIPNPKNKPQVNHINSIKTDNSVENLEWCTNKENSDHYWNGKKPKTRK